MIRRPPRSTLDRSSAASDVYKRQIEYAVANRVALDIRVINLSLGHPILEAAETDPLAVSYTHLRAHETVLDLVCRLLPENTKKLSYASGTRGDFCRLHVIL